ncbi:MAG: serine hydrolase [Proteobacteria bacterium]|nr:serine hydrolase [Pseudomonadota bacterium]MCP4920303.1 serine hydrolase [Pseudomonadota bacterium]
MLLLLLACTGPSSDSGSPDLDDSNPVDDGPAWPADRWDEAAPEDHGMSSDALADMADYAFRNRHKTQAVVVIKDGVLVGEWYADGADATTPVTSWSAAKSITSALIGIAIRDGLVDLDQTVGSTVDAWSEGDNSAITVRNMLEMRSGLPENDTLEWGVYGAEDALAYSLDRTPIREPGTEWSYVNEDSQVLGEVIHQAFGEPTTQVAQDVLFDVIGLDGAWWTDGEGNALTYCCVDSTARDFARFGLLYSRDGAWDGAQVIPTDYVSESTSGITYGGYYGLHWWRLSDEVFAALGLHGQNIYVMPSEDLVVVRFGLYTQVGDEKVRTGENGHETADPGPWDDATFIGLFQDALEP